MQKKKDKPMFYRVDGYRVVTSVKVLNRLGRGKFTELVRMYLKKITGIAIPEVESFGGKLLGSDLIQPSVIQSCKIAGLDLALLAIKDKKDGIIVFFDEEKFIKSFLTKPKIPDHIKNHPYFKFQPTMFEVDGQEVLSSAQTIERVGKDKITELVRGYLKKNPKVPVVECSQRFVEQEVDTQTINDIEIHAFALSDPKGKTIICCDDRRILIQAGIIKQSYVPDGQHRHRSFGDDNHPT